jgi:hypothetical protein
VVIIEQRVIYIEKKNAARLCIVADHAISINADEVALSCQKLRPRVAAQSKTPSAGFALQTRCQFSGGGPKSTIPGQIRSI